ncbi:MAG TPA: septal ring lytic transglycosylase RlpA family protein [Zeimonas sp.]|nr:septal ring lytic transglycosylase RlpA family protein [Zeimonas sp.]
MTTITMRGACRLLLPAATVLALAACAGPQGGRSVRSPAGDVAAATAPAPAASRGGGYYLDDGPGANPPPDLSTIPDAVPRAEPLLPRTMRPYSVFGRQYTPMTRLEPFRERGVGSWYGRRYHGQPTSSGERYDMYAMTAAHPTLPIPSYVRVTNTANGRSVVVRVNDRGPFLHDRVIDLSYSAAAKLGYVASGSAEVEVELITEFGGAAAAVAAVSPAEPPPVVTMASADATPPPPGVRAASSDGALATRAAGAAGAGAATVGAGSAPVRGGAIPTKGEPLRLEVETIRAPNEPARAERAGAAAEPAGGVASPSAASPSRVPPSTAATSTTAAPSTTAATSTAAAPSTALPAAALPAARSTANAAPAAPGFWLQLGAFGSLENARTAVTQLVRRLDWLGDALDIRQEGALYKVQAGPWTRREHANAAAERIRAATELRPFATFR